VSQTLGVAFPVYNESAVIETVLAELDRVVMTRLPSASAVAVDDASTDGTAAALDRLAGRYRWLRVEHATQNRGHGPSVCRAIAESNGDWVFQLDSDAEFDIEDFWRMWDRRGEAELVLGVRRKRHAPRHRRLLALTVSALVSLLAGRHLSDPNTPFRLFRRRLWDQLQPILPRNGLVPSISLCLGAAATSQTIVEVPVTHRPRPHGRSSLSGRGLVAFCARALIEVTAFRMRLWLA
jgi:glycosyltransferase involved in cell wall biosynthesis